MTADDTPDEITREAVVSALFDGHLVGAYVAVAEVYDEDGAPVLMVRKSDGLMPWKEIGMLRSAQNGADIIDKNGWAAAMMPGYDSDDDEWDEG